MTIAHGPASNSPIALVNVALEQWQTDACDAWERGDNLGSHRGTLEIFTGGGKSLIALECIRRATEQVPDLRVVIVVPSMALARQWRRLVHDRTGLPLTEIGELHGERKDRLDECRIVVAVINTAAQRLPEMAGRLTSPLMLVVDESHRAGAREFSRVLDTKAQFRLGLSATAERDDVDDDGAPIDYDEHVLGRKLGSIVYQFDLRAARTIGWLPDFTVHHHAVELAPAERRRYEELSRKIDDLGDRLRGLGVDTSAARSAARSDGEVGLTARAYIGGVSLRKDLLYRAQERTRVTVRIIQGVMSRGGTPRVLLFHERIDEAVALHEKITATTMPGEAGLEHSRLPESRRQKALVDLANGTTPVLVSVKSLVEGIDVPAADVGVSVASSASVRQRVQALGRVLRRRFDGSQKSAQMHVLYVRDTVDESIYEKEDWGDLTGEAANRYVQWDFEADHPTELDGPPRTPRPTEDQFWEQISRGDIEPPIEWPCDWPRQEWRLDSRGTVTGLGGDLVENPQGAAKAVRLLRPGGGRFRVSHKHRMIVVPDVQNGEARAWFVGRMDEPFRLARASLTSVGTDAGQPITQAAAPPLQPGDSYPGPGDRAGGQFKIRQKLGGVIARRRTGSEEFAETDTANGPERQVTNAVNVLAAWGRTGESGLTFYVDSAENAYYLSQGSAHYLAHVPGGFHWPS